MAALRSAIRAASRAQVLRPTATPRTNPAFQRSYASVSSPPPVTRRPADDTKSASQAEAGSEDLGGNDDPNMNGNYPDPSLTSALPIKRQFRDPYAEWWDPQERRNYGEPVHEDNDVLGIFTTEAYTHFTPGWGGVLMGCFVASVGVLMAVVARTYPDRPSAPRTYPGGLEAELGGPTAVRARISEDEEFRV